MKIAIGLAAAIAVAFVVGVKTGPTAPSQRSGPSASTAEANVARKANAAATSGDAKRPAADPNALGSPRGKPKPGERSRDPLELLDLGVMPIEIWERETRDQTWAAPVESFLGEQLASSLGDLVDGEISELEVKCRSSSCIASFVCDDSEKDLAFAYQQVVVFADVVQPWLEPLEDGSSRHRLGVHLLFGPQSRELEALKQRYQTQLNQRFPDGVRQARGVLELREPGSQ